MKAAWLERTRYHCESCGSRFEIEVSRFRCECAGVLSLEAERAVLPRDLAGRGGGLARYREAFAWHDGPTPVIDLGERGTPLIHLGNRVSAKCDFLLPTGSFKDRGVQVLIALARLLGASDVVVDSSGNAGASVAAHCASAGLSCTVVVPDSAPRAKLLQARLYGARVLEVPGGRDAASATALDLALTPGTFYASHVENPFFLEGTRGWAFEVWEQLGDAPDQVVLSVGNGSLLLGAHAGFTYLFEQGLTTRIPSIVAVQAAGWAGLADAKLDEGASTLADGIMIKSPRRLARMRRALVESRGRVLVVDDEAITSAHADLLSRGIWVEPTAAAAWAGFRGLGVERGERAVINLSGAGFKAGV